MTKQISTIADILADPDCVKKIDDLGLSPRAANALRADNLVYVGELILKSEGELLGMSNFGRVSLAEVKETLADFDLHLGTEVSDPPSLSYREIQKTIETVLAGEPFVELPADTPAAAVPAEEPAEEIQPEPAPLSPEAKALQEMREAAAAIFDGQVDWYLLEDIKKKPELGPVLIELFAVRQKCVSLMRRPQSELPEALNPQKEKFIRLAVLAHKPIP